MIPIVAIVMGIGMCMQAIYLKYRKQKEIFTMHHQERMAAIEKGIELPPLPEAFFGEDKQPHRPHSPHSRSPHRHLFIGLMCLFVGLTATLALHGEGDPDYLYGLVPAGVGVAYLIFYFVAGRKEALALEAEAKTKLPPK
jgi:hypothetical protein